MRALLFLAIAALAGCEALAPPDPPPTYRIKLHGVNGTPPEVQIALRRARDRWGQVLGPTDPAPLRSDRIYGIQVDSTADLHIRIAMDRIDGPIRPGIPNILAHAGPMTYPRPAGTPHATIPMIGRLTIDSEDVDFMAARGILEDVLLHEIGHVLGIGTLWPHVGLTSGGYFIDGRTAAAYRDAGGEGNVPVAPGHWSEESLGTELMTPSVCLISNPLSLVTIRSLVALGYEVNESAADPWRVTDRCTGGSIDIHGAFEF